MSPVYTLFHHYQQHGRKCPRTQKAHRAGLHALLQAAIAGGMRWTIDDAVSIQRDFACWRGQYRFALDENAYSLALEAANLSAAKSLEKMLGREPWLWPLPAFNARRACDRIGVGSRVWWEETWWDVTSIHADRLTICLREWTEDDYTVKSRRTLTRDMVVALAENVLDPEAIPTVEENTAAVFSRHISVQRTAGVQP